MIIEILIVIAICAFLTSNLFYNGHNDRLPPGPLRLPVLGSIIQLIRINSKHTYKAFTKLAEIYGDIMSFGFGMQTAVVVSSYEAMKDIFKLHDTNMNRYDFPFVSDRNYGKNLGIIFAHGQEWVEIRAFTKKTLKEFGYGKIKLMDQSLAESAAQVIDGIKSELLDSIDETFTVEPGKFAVHVLNIIWNLVGGYKFDPNDKLLRRNMKCMDKIVNVMGNDNLYNVFPFLRTWFPNQVNHPEHLEIHAEIHEFSKFLINDARERRCERLDAEPTSFIEVFLDKIDDNQDDPDSLYTQEQLQIILEDLMLGSLETTGTLLCWSILFMVLHPEKQAKVRQDIREKLGNYAVLPTMELKRLPYLKATILEIFRVGNVVPIPAPRSVTKDVKIRDYIIPKGTLLFFNLHAVYNEKDYWTDPEIFRPERFLNEHGEIDQLRSEKVLNTVFGIGPRICFGENIGLDSLYTYFATMLINFKFDAIPGLEPSADDTKTGTCVCPQKYSVKVTKLMS